MKDYGIEASRGYLGNHDTEGMWPFSYQYLDLLKKGHRPSAIICYNDQVAIQVLEAIRDEGLKVPDDISVTGYDDSYLAVASEVSLSSLFQSGLPEP